ncbi:Fcf1-domain-containing protein [Calocera cornea HHB12733]|uniref:U three protein 23 n=1 Tax=Calocera cornea HHB12733 TaxID=1353952 RepID=A0A165EBV1_9BASI|nr:Fcf1-domain-containing protein [Calocera cornea HHB12733]
MRQKRAKAYRKLMAQYERAFGFRHPYQVLVNADFCEMGIQLKMDLMKELETVLQSKVKPMITQCCISTLYKLGPAGQRIVDLAKTFERRRCGHLETPLEPDECMLTVVGAGNKHRYVVATQSENLRRKMREVEGVPIVALNRAVMVLEMMSEKSKGKIRAMEEQQLAASKEEVAALRPALKAAIKATEGDKPPPAPLVRKKKPKAPNPLSVRKKKPKPVPQAKPPVPRVEPVVNLGKRSRDEGEDEDAGGQDGVEHAEGKRKRKRRKKHQPGGDTERAIAVGEQEDGSD